METLREALATDEELRNEFVADQVRCRIALLIRRLREQCGMTQEALAAKAGTSQTVIARLENPDYGHMTLRTLLRVAAALGRPLHVDMPEWADWYDIPLPRSFEP